LKKQVFNDNEKIFWKWHRICINSSEEKLFFSALVRLRRIIFGAEFEMINGQWSMVNYQCSMIIAI